MLSGKLTKALVKSLGPGRHGDGNGLYLVVDSSGARRWICRVVVKGQKNKAGKPLRTDFGLGGADIVTIHDARARAQYLAGLRLSQDWPDACEHDWSARSTCGAVLHLDAQTRDS